MSLDSYGKEEEDNEMNNLKIRLEFTNNIVLNLSKQLDELKETVSERRRPESVRTTSKIDHMFCCFFFRSIDVREEEE